MLQFELVLPAYNESKSLSELVSQTCKAAKSHGLTPESFQLVVVNNGSLDDTESVLATLLKGPLAAWLRIVTVPLNQGYGHGLWLGLQSTTAPIVGYSHADLQCDPNDAFRGLAYAKQAKVPTLVKGERRGRPLKDRTVSRVFEACARATLNLNAYEVNAQPKVFPRQLLGRMTTPPKTFAFDLYLMYHAAKAQFGSQTIEVDFSDRAHGVSNWAASLASRYKTIGGMVKYMVQLAQREGRLGR